MRITAAGREKVDQAINDYLHRVMQAAHECFEELGSDGGSIDLAGDAAKKNMIGSTGTD